MKEPKKGSLFRIARISKGISQWELSRLVGVSQAIISVYERGLRRPGDPLIRHKLSEVLQVDEDLLFPEE